MLEIVQIENNKTQQQTPFLALLLCFKDFSSACEIFFFLNLSTFQGVQGPARTLIEANELLPLPQFR